MPSLSYTVTPDDFLAYMMFVGDKARYGQRYRHMLLLVGSLLLGLVLACGIWFGAFPVGDALSWLPAFAGFAVVVEAMLYATAGPIYRARVRQSVRQRLGASPSSTFLGPHRLDATPEALLSEGAQVRSTLAWDALRTVEETPDHLFLVLGASQALIVPKRDLPSADLRAFTAAVADGMGAARR